ncbi:MAG TPA: 4-hydroxythreonine-4-phosphate dehydrogenase PdxA [Hyphomicrobiaceae bacterium]|nr:4-hydroxythreonine-4-phosphate dehydrogenase PdxA [Hyphomicrobiaceae bacterium]
MTMGEPAGIGLELCLQIWRRASQSGQACRVVPVLYADPTAVALYARHLGLEDPAHAVDTPGEAIALWPARLPVKPVPLLRQVEPGRPDAANARAVIGAIEQATEAVVRGQAAALVTNPIAKRVLYESGFRYAGHTDFLAALADRLVPGGPHRPVMMLASRELRVVPLTIHVPLASVAGEITRERIIETARIVDAALSRDFGVGRDINGRRRARIAVTGLNPHAGEGGTIGTEDRDVIAPAVAALGSEGLDISGPHAADTLFHAAARARFDAVIAMYHDQALIPIKTLAFETAVNVTLGLPFIRTSPDHGTAFEIAGKGRASATSFAEALELAAALTANRAAATVL